ncbi:MAG: TonB family protein [Candidatus Obscuribacterales bacterium]|nr:TonB family protein [Candidatus Obscuribacterales bacterium]
MWATTSVSVRVGAVLWLLAATLSISSIASEPTQKITEEQAIKIAEKFIAENGYTSAAPISSPVARESLTMSETEAEERASRHDTLEPKAYGILPGSARGKGSPPYAGWTVIFRYSKRAYLLNELTDKEAHRCGRAVTMDEFGHEIMVQHKDIFLKTLDKSQVKASGKPHQVVFCLNDCAELNITQLSPHGTHSSAQKYDFSGYLTEVQRRLRRTWFPPKDGGVCTIKFQIQGNGSVEAISVIRSSGTTSTDESAIEAVRKAAPFPAFSPQNAGEKIDIKFTFDYNVFNKRESGKF